MCGICGEIAKTTGSGAASVEAIARMNEAMVRRGPDAHGIYSRQNMAFGHRRLKIIDLSENAAQPMFDPMLGLSIVFNGAIYNYPQLRKELEQKGYTFFSHGDTEVILKSYHAWGEKCVEKLSGMFAFAVWELKTGKVFMARDRLGIKPLYYSESNGVFRFASSLPALLKAGGVDTSIDEVALHHYMSFHAVVPAPYTIIKGIRKLPPASTMTVEPDGSKKTRVYWRVQYGAHDDEKNYSFEDWQQKTLEVLRLSVERRLLADVPVGVLLSGGLDSSLVVGLLAENGKASDINTFSIGFESVGGEKGDEFQYSDIIAKHYNTIHHKIEVNSERTLPALEDCVATMSEPMVSHDAIGFYLLSQEVAKHVKVVQSGQGADEIFAGYHWYPPMMKSETPVDDYARVFFDRDHEEYSRAVNPQFVSEDFSRQFVADHFAMQGAERAIDKTLRLDSNIMLVDDPVKRVDNMTMAWGLEARVPFLDHEVVELAARIPAEFKVPQEGKYVLKEAARKVIPHEVIDRPKGYFPVPALKYLQGEYLDFVTGILNKPAAKSRGLFQQSYIDNLLKEPEKHITPLRGSKLWQVALLEYWLQQHNIS